MPPTSLAHRSASSVCTTPECYKTGETLKSFVNLNVDPCSDFFQYTCGSWVNSEHVKEQEESYNFPTEIENNSLDYIIKLLNGTFDDLHKIIKTKDTTYHTEDQMNVDKQNFELVKSYYEICADTKTISEMGATPIFPHMALIENTLFPTTSNSTDSKNMAATLSFFINHGVETFVKVQVVQNPLDHDYNGIIISQPDLDANTAYTDIESLKAYQTTVTEIMSTVLGGPSSDGEYEQLVVEESQKGNFTLWSASKIESAVSSFIDFEMQLAAIKNINSTLDDLNEFPTLKDLQAISTIIPWDVILTQLVSADYATPDLQLAFIPEQIQQLEELLSVTPVQALQEYFVIRAVMTKSSGLQFPDGVYNPTMSTSTGLVSKSAAKDTFRAPTTRDPATLTPEERCGGETSINFKHIVGRFFALETLGATEAKKEVEEFVDVIYAAWLEDITKATWIDQKTRVKLIQKIEALRKFVAYSETSPDWRNPTALEEYYQGYTINNGMNYFDTVGNFVAWKNTKLWKTLGHKLDMNEWDDDNNYPHYFNAHYFPNDNKIEIPIGILQNPLYNSQNPKYMNYGSIGSIIGHELTHSLDSNGRFYNASGYPEDLFSNSTGETYDKKSQCFIEQYNNFTLTGVNDIQLPLDGQNVLAENIADAGGLNIAFHAYQNYVKKMGKPEKTLPGFEHLTPEQLFFVSHGLFTCSVVKKSDAQILIDTDVHAPLYYRNIGLFQNSADFAKAFNCPAGSPMNPHKKCSVW